MSPSSSDDDIVRLTDEDEVLGPDVDGDEAAGWPESPWRMPLRTAVDHKGQTYDHLVLREPTGREWEEINAQAVKARRRWAISLIAGIPLDATAKMGIGDLVRAETYFYAFFELGQKIDGR